MNVIIPVYNIRKRGYERLHFSIYSLQNQSVVPNIYICDGSSMGQEHDIRNIAKTNGANYIHVDLKEFNKPILLNKGLAICNDEPTMCTDVDYIFKKDFCKTLMKNYKDDRYIVKQVMMSPTRLPTQKMIDDWDFPMIYLNKYGKMADGACQFASKEWFNRCGGYDERMAGWGCMDNQMTKRASLGDMEVFWMEESVIIHQWHKVEKGKKARDITNAKRNRNILDQTNDFKV